MQIEQEEEIIPKEKGNGNKLNILMIVLIVLTIMAVIGIIYAIMYFQSKRLSIIIDGKAVSLPENTIVFKENGDIHISIKDIAEYVGYEAHNGEYKVDVEDPNKMYVEAIDGTETTSFFRNSKVISKVAPNTTDDYDNITLDEAVYMEGDKMYTTSKGFMIGFNAIFEYDENKNRITITTLETLVDAYSKAIENYGYSKLSEDFNNRKALIYGMIVALNDKNGKYGVISTDGTEILSPRYNDIQFIEGAGEFIITNSSEKVGIAYSNGKTKITVSYDEIKIMDRERGLYVVKSNEKYGVIDSQESFVIHIEYDRIGIDSSKYPADNIKNQYILFDYIVPARLNGKWTLLNVDGQKIVEDTFDEVGYIAEGEQSKVVNNAVSIGETGTVVVSKDKKYGGIDVKGNTLIDIRFDAIYSMTTAGVTNYYILFNGIEYNAEDFINAMKERLGYNIVEEPVTEPEQGNDNTIDTNTVNNVGALNQADVVNTTQGTTNSTNTNNV